MANWKIATLKESKQIAVNVKMLRFIVEGWEQHMAGQHYDIRLTAPNGYSAERSYSLANPSQDKGVAEFGVQLLDDGEVSPYLWSIVPGDQIEMRGPIGGHFVWDTGMQGDLILIGGGSGLVPLVSMIREYKDGANHEQNQNRRVICLASVRTLEHLIYRDELEALQKEKPHFSLVPTLTQSTPTDWKGYARRVDRGMIEEVTAGIDVKMALVYVCGPTKFVEAVTKTLLDMSYPAHAIKTERFG